MNDRHRASECSEDGQRTNKFLNAAGAPCSPRRCGNCLVLVRLVFVLLAGLVHIDDNLRVVPELAEALEHPDDLTYVAAVASDVPYIPLWYKTNVAVFQPGIHGVRLSPIADFTFLKNVYRDAQ